MPVVNVHFYDMSSYIARIKTWKKKSGNQSLDWELWIVLVLQPTPEEEEQDDEDGDVDDVSESDNDELDTDMIDERDSADDVMFNVVSH